MKHQVVINVSDSNGEKAQILKGAQLTLPKRMIKWLFGEYTQVFIMKPGQTIQSVDVKEVKKGETHAKYGQNHNNHQQYRKANRSIDSY